MANRRVFPPHVEQSGAGVLSIVAELDDLRNVGLRILARHGIENPDPTTWYPLQSFLDALRELSELSGPATLRAIGLRIPEKAHWPPGITTVEAALKSLDAAYHMNLRGGDVGHYTFTQTGPRSGQVVCDNPFPCAFDRGILERVLEKFVPPGSTPGLVRAHPETCRELGGESCTYVLKW